MRRGLLSEIIGQYTFEASYLNEAGEVDYVALADKWMDLYFNTPPDEDFPLPKFKGLEQKIFVDRFLDRLSLSQLEMRHGLSAQEVLQLVENVAKRIHQKAIKNI